MIEALNWTAYGFAGLLAPGLWFVARWYSRRFTQVVVTWRKPQMAVFTILAFIASLFFFVVGCFFLVQYWGIIEGIATTRAEPDLSLHLGLDSLLLLFGTVVTYLAVSRFLTQYVTAEGIVLDRYNRDTMNWERIMLEWRQITDYYIHADYPITQFNFLIRNAEGITERHSLRVPFYARARFEALLDNVLEDARTERVLKQTLFRNISPS